MAARQADFVFNSGKKKVEPPNKRMLKIINIIIILCWKCIILLRYLQKSEHLVSCTVVNFMVLIKTSSGSCVPTFDSCIEFKFFCHDKEKVF